MDIGQLLAGSPSTRPGRPRDRIEESVRLLSDQQLQDLVCRLSRTSSDNRKVIEQALRNTPRSIETGITETGRRGRLEICILCYAEYDESENGPGACEAVHKGKHQLDDSNSFWDDHDYKCHGDPFSRELMESDDFAEGYTMSCCGKRPNEPGCTPAAHKSASSARAAKRARMDEQRCQSGQESEGEGESWSE